MSKKESKTKGMLDKMVGGFSGGHKGKGRYPPGQLQRPSSVGNYLYLTVNGELYVNQIF